MKKIYSMLFIFAFFVVQQSVFAVFVDVFPYHQNATAINWLNTNGVVQGYADNTYKPDQYINRAEFLKILWLSSGHSDPCVYEQCSNPPCYYPAEMLCQETVPFSDVNVNDWFYSYVKAAFYYQIINGYSDSTFKPNNEILYSEALKIVIESTFGMENIVDDYCVNHAIRNNYDQNTCTTLWYWKYAVFAEEHKIYPEYHPEINTTIGWKVTRGDMAEMIYRAKSVRDSYIDGFIPFESALVPNSRIERPEYFSFANSDYIAIGDFKTSKVYATNSNSPRTVLNTTIEFSGEDTFIGNYTIGDELSVFSPDPLMNDLSVIPRPFNYQGEIFIYFAADAALRETLGQKGIMSATINNLKISYSVGNGVMLEADIVDVTNVIKAY